MNRIHFQIYQARDGFRWRLWAVNNRIVAESGESYASITGVRDAIDWFKRNGAGAPVA